MICKDAQTLMKSYYLPALALFTRLLWLFALPNRPLPSKPRVPRMGFVIFHAAEEISVETRCLRGFVGSPVADNGHIGEGAKPLSVAYRYEWTRDQFVETRGTSLPPVRPLMEVRHWELALKDLRKDKRFDKVNEPTESFSRLINILTKPPYLVHTKG